LVSLQNCNERYDIYSLDGGEKRHDEAGLLEAVASIKKIVDEEVKAGIPLDRIVVGGFSQGGAVALLYSCLAGEKMAGFIGLSTYLPLESKVGEFLKKAGKANILTPVFMGHGSSVSKLCSLAGCSCPIFLGTEVVRGAKIAWFH
jgi:predicted esterase